MMRLFFRGKIKILTLWLRILVAYFRVKMNRRAN